MAIVGRFDTNGNLLTIGESIENSSSTSLNIETNGDIEINELIESSDTEDYKFRLDSGKLFIKGELKEGSTL